MYNVQQATGDVGKTPVPFTVKKFIDIGKLFVVSGK
jgi:hypothetical protein